MTGATGAVGGALVRELLGSAGWTSVLALVRRPTDMFDAMPGRDKLRVEVIDLADLELATGRHARGMHAAFCTLGLGQPRKSTREEFWRVDVEYAGAFARGAATAGVKHISLLSSVGADPGARPHYLRVKGAAEQEVVSAGISRTSLFRPSLLVTREIRYGLQDRFTQALFPLVAPFLPARLHQIRVEDLARAMRLNAEREGEWFEILQYPECAALLAY